MGKVNPGPRAPVAVGIINVAAAGKDFIVSPAPHFRASPAGEDVRILHVALKGPFACGSAAHQEDLAQIAAGAIEASVGSFAEGRNLVGAGLEQVHKCAVGLDGINASLVSGTGDQVSGRIKCQGIDNVFAGRPQLAGRTVGGDQVNIRAHQINVGRKRSTAGCGSRVSSDGPRHRNHADCRR